MRKSIRCCLPTTDHKAPSSMTATCFPKTGGQTPGGNTPLDRRYVGWIRGIWWARGAPGVEGKT